MPRVLKDLHITEVSSVDRGAGEGVKVMLIKRDGQTDDHPIKKEGDMPTPAELKKAEEDKAAFDAAVAKVAEAAVAKALASRDAEIAVLKMSDDEKAYCADQKMTDEQQKSFAAMKPEERQAKMKKIDDGDPIAKALAPVLAEMADLKKRNAVLENDKAVADFQKRAVGMGLKPEDGEIIRKAYAGDVEAQKTLDGKITALNKQIAELDKTGKVFDEFGTTKGKDGASAYDQLVAKAAELRKVDTKLTPEGAFTKVFTDPANRELADQHKREEMRKKLTVVAA
jgi:hypothetical protein